MQRFAVCPTCEGRGSHTNPAIDGNGITADEMFELGEDFREDYLSGVYDVRCRECGGNRVVPACRCGEPIADGLYLPVENLDGTRVPYSACYEHLTEDEREWRDGEAESAAERAAELRMGA